MNNIQINLTSSLKWTFLEKAAQMRLANLKEDELYLSCGAQVSTGKRDEQQRLSTQTLFVQPDSERSAEPLRPHQLH